jgi:hypothetical protein
MTRTSRNVLLGLVGSSALFGSYVAYCEYRAHQRRLEQEALATQGAGGDFGPDQNQQAQAQGGAATTTGSTTHHHTYSRSPSWWWWSNSGRSYTSGGTSGVGSARPSSGGGSTGSVTGRGGFGSSGHAASGGS